MLAQNEFEALVNASLSNCNYILDDIEVGNSNDAYCKLRDLHELQEQIAALAIQLTAKEDELNNQFYSKFPNGVQ